MKAPTTNIIKSTKIINADAIVKILLKTTVRLILQQTVLFSINVRPTNLTVAKVYLWLRTFLLPCKKNAITPITLLNAPIIYALPVQINSMKLQNIIIVFAYACIFAISLAVLYILRPFSYTDNDASKLQCENDRIYNTGPNYIYTFGTKLDSFNDMKARKLCAYDIIWDYGGNYKTPGSVNYKLSPVIKQESSWSDATIIALGVLITGFLTSNLILRFLHLKFGHSLINLAIIVISGSVVFLIFLIKPSKEIYCANQIATKVMNIRNATYKNGIYKFTQENEWFKKMVGPLYQACIK